PAYAKYTRYFGDDLTPTLTIPGAVIAGALTSHGVAWGSLTLRSEEHTSELQSHLNLVCRLLLEKKKAGDIPGTSDARTFCQGLCRLAHRAARGLAGGTVSAGFLWTAVFCIVWRVMTTLPGVLML